uniref:Leucine-rich repeat-containing N-terminal plant-type domain-containing protein n=1 Tax=Ananas comosus var. bracteatus TaxID=296719 RepID=A0A6V7QSW3_ANACO
MATHRRLLLLLFFCLASVRAGLADTNSQDVAALQALMNNWQNVPPNWGQNSDPCGSQWDGIICTNGRITSLRLPSMSLKGQLPADIAQLSALNYLDLSSNPDLGGPLTPSIGNLKQLTTLILAGCSFTGNIPQELGNLGQLYFLALNSNNFTGRIPGTLGLLSNLNWFDVAENQLSGPLPVSSNSTPGLDLLVNTQHFHFNKNQLSGQLQEKLFNSKMILIHLLFDGNKFTGPIPTSVGLLQKLQILRLDKNQFSGNIPASITNLTTLNELHLAGNELQGTVPDLSALTNLNYVDLSNNTFDSSPAPPWFSTLTSLNALFWQRGGLTGKIPTSLFALPQLQQVVLATNTFNGTLNMSSNLGPDLQTVDFQDNAITQIDIASSYSNTLILVGNPVCLDSQYANGLFCS